MKNLLALFMTGIASMSFAQDITVDNAFALQPNPAAKNGAVFMQINNHSDKEIHITGAKSESAKMVQLHSTLMDGDVMKMQEVEEGLRIPAGGCALLERGGYHVMLMGLNAPLAPDAELDLTLVLDDEEWPVTAIVTKEVPEADEESDCIRAHSAMHH